MAWPLPSDFRAILQHPKLAFRDPAMQGWTIERDSLNQPRPWAGAFAVVFKGYDQQGKPVAIRTFSTESPERRERYELIADYLKGRQVKCLVPFEYRENAVRSFRDGKWYPLILMEWVEGQTLFNWAQTKCAACEVATLRHAADSWLGVISELAEVRVAHGDLQHANVLVTDEGQFRLVDYDGMCVPALVGRRNLEVGVEPYQHPGRNSFTTLSLRLDNFSALLIYTSLRAIAAAPGLWQKHVESRRIDKLLFDTQDLHTPDISGLCRDLRRSEDHVVRQLTEAILRHSELPMEQVPSLLEILATAAIAPDRTERQQPLIHVRPPTAEALGRNETSVLRGARVAKEPQIGRLAAACLVGVMLTLSVGALVGLLAILPPPINTIGHNRPHVGGREPQPQIKSGLTRRPEPQTAKDTRHNRHDVAEPIRKGGVSPKSAPDDGYIHGSETTKARDSENPESPSIVVQTFSIPESKSYLQPLGYYEKRRYEQELRELELQRLRQGDSAGLLVDRGIYYVRLRQYPRAIEQFSNAIGIDPLNSRAYFNRGVTQLIVGSLDAAIADLSETIRLESDHASGYAHRALAYQKKGAFEQANQDWQRSKELGFREVERGLQVGTNVNDRVGNKQATR